MITVVGLGLNKDSVSIRGLNKIRSAQRVILRTKLTTPSKPFAAYESLDWIYEQAQSFDELNSMIANELISLSRDCDLVYCVDGDGYKDSSVIELKKLTEIEIIPGPFDLDIEPATTCVYIGAYDIADGFYPDPKMPVCIYGIDDRSLACDVKLFLLRFFAPETQIILASARGRSVTLLEELDRQKRYSVDTAVYVEGGNNSSFADLLRIMARLTARDGCPWDKVQTHESIRINMIEEAYETVQAITDGNVGGMIEELGDVLLQVVFHCDIAARSGEFTLEDVIKGLNDKLISRHTHIFGGDKAENADGALSVWEKNKMKEKHQDTFAAAVNDVPQCFPALLRAQKVAKRVGKGGWKLSEQALLDKISSILKGADEAAFGELLMLLAFLFQQKGLDAEQLLLDKVAEVQRTFTEYERLILEEGKDVNDLTDDERSEYYKRAKML